MGGPPVIFGIGVAMYGLGVLMLSLATRAAFDEPLGVRNMVMVGLGWLAAAAVIFAVVRADRIVG